MSTATEARKVNLDKTPKPRPRASKPGWLDWAAGHGPVTGAAAVASGCSAIATAGALTGMPPGWGLAVGAAGALGHGAGQGIARRLSVRSLATRAASWLLAGGWTTYALATGPLSWAAAGSLAALACGVGAMAHSSAVYEEAREEDRLAAARTAVTAGLDAERRTIAEEWGERIARITRIEATVWALEMWPTGSGFTLGLELPGGATWEAIARSARAFAADARLPVGCTVTVEQGDVQGRAVVDVATRNVLADVTDYPADFSPLSLMTGVPWGVLSNGRAIELFLRESGVLVVGPPGSGKSTFMDGVLTSFTRCVDVLTFMIDLKGGALGRPWVRTWLEANGRLSTPNGMQAPPQDVKQGVDWIASTPAEAALMLKTILRIQDARQSGYQELMTQQNTTLLPVSAKLPMIEVIVDEGAELLSHQATDPAIKQVRKLLKRVMRTTRAMGIRTVLTAVDGTVSALGDTEVRKFSPVGVVLTSGDNTGGNVPKMFGQRARRIDTDQLRWQGCGVIGDATATGFPPVPFKSWRTAPSLAREATIATSDLHPTLDAISARAAGIAYSDRWSDERCGWLWTTHDPAPEEDGPSQAAEDTTADKPRSGGLHLKALDSQTPDTIAGTVAAFRKDMDDMLGPDAPIGGTPGPDVPEERPADARQAVLELLRGCGARGESTGMLAMKLRAAGFVTARTTVSEWLSAWAAEPGGPVVRTGAGSKTRYVHREHAPGA